MPRKKRKKINKKVTLESSVSSISVSKNGSYEPYIQVFDFSSKNIERQRLGRVMGVFEIKEFSKDSAYIVNFISSVLKKEYFSNTKRTSSESFESALHKVNLALSEVAKHGNINWIGNFNTAVCSVEGNNIHFSASGKAKVLLIRNQSIIDISEGMSPEDEDPNPIKTFSDISSGKIEKGDKVIITTDDIFEIFSMHELKKGSMRFAGEKFHQFISTALINEAEIAGTVIIDFDEKIEIEKRMEPEVDKKEEYVNAFSGKSFDKKKKTKAAIEQIKEADEGEYTDKKTGHIYIKDDDPRKDTGNEDIKLIKFKIKEGLAVFFHDLKSGLSQKKRSLAKFARDKMREIKESRKEKSEEKEELQIEKSTPPEKKIEKKHSIENIIKAGDDSDRDKDKHSEIKNFPSDLGEKIRNILPNLSKIKGAIISMDYQQRIYSLLAVVVIISAPLIFIKIKNELRISSEERQKESIEEIVMQEEEEFLINLSSDKNIRLNTVTNLIYQNLEAEKLFIVNDEVFSLGNNSITRESDKKKYQIPEEFGKEILSSVMEDLNLIFILTEKNRVVSFSPVSENFQENAIDIPGEAKIDGMSTYLTYLYLLDSSNNQIYRYPRSEGGFGEKENWIKGEVSIENPVSMAIDENIYIANENEVLKMFRGAKEDFLLENSLTPIKFKKIITKDGLESIYALDSENGRVVRFSKEGQILQQYQSQEIIEAKSFLIEEKNNRAIILTKNGDLLSMEL